ncbi:MoaD/ThiS family protein [Varibaculum cambriense]|uniref:molybdopterin synthase sulfur carrier subunit n=1 Tax=uncultured Varibaculum sp. TaxID=413896 RepID=UPI000C7C3A32|nr:molybdopterin synthase sulfur carrier subunit [uncultured Varibaculum sp.]WIK88548.1 MoaD/ThiS family protein [Varibaculum cambriense]
MVTVRFFAGAAQAAGVDSASVPAAAHQTLREIAQAASSNNLAPILEVSSFLVDGALADGDTPLGESATNGQLDVLPPFAGG